VAILFVFGIRGFNVPCRNLVPGEPPAWPGLRLLTCNVQRGDLKVREIAEPIRETWPELVPLQEDGRVDPRVLLGQESAAGRVRGLLERVGRAEVGVVRRDVPIGLSLDRGRQVAQGHGIRVVGGRALGRSAAGARSAGGLRSSIALALSARPSHALGPVADAGPHRPQVP
jgi:hypothetical protein